MTLKEFMEENYPKYLDRGEPGGVKICPQNYAFL